MDLLSDLPDILTPIEVGTVLKVGRTTTYALIRRNEIKHIKIGRKILVPRKYLEEFIEKSSGEWYHTTVQIVGNPACCGKGAET